MTKSTPTQVSVHAAKTHLSNLLQRAEKGEDIVIARGKKPVVRLVLVGEEEKPARPGPGALKGLIEVPDSFFEPMTDAELTGWE